MKKINLILLFFCLALCGCPDNPDPLTSKEYAEMNCPDCTLTYTARSALIRQLLDKRNAEIEQLKARLTQVEQDCNDWRFALERVSQSLTNCQIERDGCRENLPHQSRPADKILLIKPVPPNLEWLFPSSRCFSPDAPMWCP